jgi:CBS domain-containing protein
MSSSAELNAASRTVREIMTENVLTVAPSQTTRLATQMMLWSSLRQLPVVDDGKLVGMLTERDLLRAGATDGIVSDTMTESVDRIAPGGLLSDAAGQLADASSNCLAVVEDDVLLGIVTTTDLLQQMSRPHARADEPLVRDVMSSMTIRAGPQDDVLDVVAMMVREGVRHVPVVDSERRILGVVSDRDVRTVVGDPLQALQRNEDINSDPWPIESVMTASPITISADAPLDDLAKCLVDESIGAVPVVDAEGRLTGVASYVDLIAFAYR